MKRLTKFKTSSSSLLIVLLSFGFAAGYFNEGNDLQSSKEF